MKLKSAVFLNALSAAFEQLKSRSAAVAPRLTLEAIQGEFVRFAEFFDSFEVYDGTGAIDELSFHIFKDFASVDEISAVEDAVFAFNKSLADNGIVTEQHRYDFIKSLADDAMAVDQFVSVLGKGFSDTSSLGDEIDFKALGKTTNDPLLISQLLAKDMTKIVGDDTSQDYTAAGYFFEDYIEGVPTEILAIADIYLGHLAKVFNDSSSVSDAFSKQVAYSRGFTDSVFFTDDVDGAASILDDQEMQFFKFTNNAASVGDQIGIVTGFNRTFGDIAASTDTARRSTSKALANAFGVTDDKNVLTGKHIYDMPVVSEVLAKSTSAARSDSALLGDANTFAFSKLLQDLTSTADAGSLRSQNYSDFTYFGEDFVGASRTF
jgi:hypothetical protein